MNATTPTTIADEFCTWLNCAAADVLTDGSVTYNMTTDDESDYGWQVATQDMLEEFEAWRDNDGPVTFTFGFSDNDGKTITAPSRAALCVVAQAMMPKGWTVKLCSDSIAFYNVNGDFIRREGFDYS